MTLHQSGFTLIELMVVTAITAILATTAYPSFQGPIHKARRSDGIVALLQLQMNQERWRSHHGRYASLAELRTAATSPLRYYELNVAEADTGGYSIVAVATGAQAGDRPCRVLRLTVAAGDTIQASGPDERTGNPAADNKRCWGL